VSGFVEKRASGRWRARYRGLDGRERSKTFDRRVDADRWLAGVAFGIARGEWTDPARARITVGDWSGPPPHRRLARHRVRSVGETPAAMLGHKDAAMTLNVYASLFEDDLDDVSDRLDASLLEAAAACVRPGASPRLSRCLTRPPEQALD